MAVIPIDLALQSYGRRRIQASYLQISSKARTMSSRTGNATASWLLAREAPMFTCLAISAAMLALATVVAPIPASAGEPSLAGDAALTVIIHAPRMRVAERMPVAERMRVAEAARSDLSGQWSIVDPRVQTTVASVTMERDGTFRSGPFKGRFVGPNGLGANRWRFADGVLAFIYVAPGRPRVDEMLLGYVENVSPAEFRFTVAGGYYGQGAGNMILLFRRQ
jgi:hypothetical protein